MKALTISLLIGLVMTAGAAWGQVEVEWERTFQTRSYSFYSRILTNDNRIIIAGGGYESEEGQSDLYIQWLNEQGDSLYAASFGTDVFDICHDLTECENGYFITSLSSNDADVFLNGVIRLDEEGRQVNSYFEEIHEAPVSHDYFLRGLRVGDGLIQLSNDYNSETRVRSVRLVKFNSQLEADYQRNFRMPASARALSMEWIGEDTIGIVGLTVDENRYNWGVFLMSVGSDGDSIGYFSYLPPGIFEIDYVTVARCPDNSLIIAAAAGFPASLFLCKFELDGDTVWTKRIETVEDIVQYEPPQYGQLIRMILLKDGGFLLALSYSIYDSFNLMRFNEDGDAIWSWRYEGEVTFYDVCKSEDDGYLLIGSMGNEAAGRARVFLLKTTPDPASVREPPSPLMPYALSLEPPFPNPFNSTTRITFTSPINREATRLAIFDPLGRRVAELTDGKWKMENGTRHSVVWNAAGYPAGGYIVRLEAGSQQIERTIVLTK